MKSSSKIIMLLFVLLLILPNVAYAKDNQKIGKMLEISGTVQVKKGGGEKLFKAFKNMAITQGDTVITGEDGKAKLEIDADKEVIVGPDTKLVISELVDSIKAKSGKTSLTLLGGKVMVNVKQKLDGDSKFEIRTPTAIMGVMGTEFWVSHTEQGTRVGVFDGNVLIGVFAIQTNEDGTKEVVRQEISVGENEQTPLIDGTAVNAADLQVQPMSIEDLDLYILEVIKEDSARFSKELVDRLDEVIGKKTVEQAQRLQERREKRTAQGRSEIIRDGQQGAGGGGDSGSQPGNGGNENISTWSVDKSFQQPQAVTSELRIQVKGNIAGATHFALYTKGGEQQIGARKAISMSIITVSAVFADPELIEIWLFDGADTTNPMAKASLSGKVVNGVGNGTLQVIENTNSPD